MEKKQPKYNQEQEDEMRALFRDDLTYDEQDEYVEMLMTKYRKTKRMIVAKLSKMQLYKKRPKVSKITKKKAETKESMVRRLEVKFGWPPLEFEGLEAAPKLVLLKLLEEYLPND